MSRIVWRRVATGENLDRHRRVARHRLGFFRREPAGLEQHFVGDADLADVVQQGRDFQRVAFGRIELHDRRPRTAAERHPHAVRRGGRILAAERGVQPAGDAEAGVNQLGFVAVGQVARGRAAALCGRFVERLKQRRDFGRAIGRVDRYDRRARRRRSPAGRIGGGVIGHVGDGGFRDSRRTISRPTRRISQPSSAVTGALGRGFAEYTSSAIEFSENVGRSRAVEQSCGRILCRVFRLIEGVASG